MSALSLFLQNNILLTIFLVAALGYLLGAVKVRGISLGTSAVLLVALAAGHFGARIPSIVKTVGLAFFIVSVGLTAGPTFFRQFRGKGWAYILVGIFMVVIGSAVTILLCKLFRVPAELAMGIFSGASTSTPGLAAAMEATGSDLTGVGYGVAYPFGIILKMLFVQLIPRILGLDVDREVAEFEKMVHLGDKPPFTGAKLIEKTGLLVAAVVIVLGALLGKINVPVPGGLHLSLGNAGGILIIGIIVGHFGHIGKISLKVPHDTLAVMREVGLCLFLVAAGVSAGEGFVEVVRDYGVKLFFIGIGITATPFILATLVLRGIFKWNAVRALSAICGGMTSTPALGDLMDTFHTEDVATIYAASYPFALLTIILSVQIMPMIW